MGAIIMTALAAVHGGAGLVTVADPDWPFIAMLPEAMGFDLADSFVNAQKASDSHGTGLR